MDCRETQMHLTAFHDGELPDADRVRVEDHLRGCQECSRLRDDLARADGAAGVPDPGSGYWDRFNARVADRIEREAEGPKVSVLRPKQGWMRQQLRYLVPAAAAAALVVVVVRYGGQGPVAPVQTVPSSVEVKEKPVSDMAGQRVAKADREPSPVKKTEDATATRSAPVETYRTAGGPAVPLPTDAPDAEPQFAAKEKSAPVTMLRRNVSPCEMAQTLAAQERFVEAETAQRECLAQDPSPPTQEKGLIFLAELLDRQTRFDEADTVLAEAHRQFPKSLPLDLYRQQRPMVQKRQMTVPGNR